ncbi:hypothetical protein Hanom_Chr04g00294201 [Helianthus anomalus]
MDNRSQIKSLSAKHLAKRSHCARKPVIAFGRLIRFVEYIFLLYISPDDVVGLIGQKHFSKARRAIVRSFDFLNF